MVGSDIKTVPTGLGRITIFVTRSLQGSITTMGIELIVSFALAPIEIQLTHSAQSSLETKLGVSWRPNTLYSAVRGFCATVTGAVIVVRGAGNIARDSLTTSIKDINVLKSDMKVGQRV
jgi:hypothetical protein